MDSLHRQVILDCYDDIRRDMDPTLILRYGRIDWRDGDQGLIKGKVRNMGKYYGATDLLEKLLDLPYDGFEDFIQSLKDVPYNHLVQQLLETRVRLQTAVENGQIRRRDLGRRPQDITRWTRRRQGAAGVLLAGLVICAWILAVDYRSGLNGTPSMALFPRRLRTFVGREDVFSDIDACLKQNQTCLIKGLGGVGKTTLAIEYGHRRADWYPGGVFWVRQAVTMPPNVDSKPRRVRFITIQEGLEALDLNDSFGGNTEPIFGNHPRSAVLKRNNRQRKRKRSLEDEFDREAAPKTAEQKSDDITNLPEALQCLRRLKKFVVREGHTNVLDNILETENVLEEKWCEERLVRSSSKTVKQTTVTDFFRKR
ncbi:Hypp3708 [Branchiostoma lanceolatum]|uniref:Hypp3708 protein n=1 Tax=Branchiostoma lanceolatum TaxID=7740 RepID=A0A8K0A255_BRALA|nr:Hypp3708 [Branchiostoma lanceolatum]